MANLRTLPSLAACIALASAAPAQSFTFTDFSSTAGLNLVGGATQSGTVLQLQDNTTPANSSDNRGAAWYATPVCVVNGFDTTFQFSMHTPIFMGGSEGMAFVIQNDQVAGTSIIVGAPSGTGNLAIGRHGAGMGYGRFPADAPGESVDNSLAIELDTGDNQVWGDGNGNHISVHTGGSGDNNHNENNSIGRTGFVSTDLNDALTHTIRILYVPGTLEVYLNGNLELSIAYDIATGGTLIDSMSSVGGLDLIDGSSAYVGFTSGAGVGEFRDVHSWSWDSCENPTPYCFGEGGGAACPCGNSGAPGNGCAHSLNAAGANLAVTGAASVANDTLVLSGSGMPSAPALYFQGTGQQGGGLGVQFGDGLRCVGGTNVWLGIKHNVGGASMFPEAGDPPVSVKGMVAAPGTRYYQVWFRNAAAFCTGATFNLTNGVEVPWI